MGEHLTWLSLNMLHMGRLPASFSRLRELRQLRILTWGDARDEVREFCAHNRSC